MVTRRGRKGVTLPNATCFCSESTGKMMQLADQHSGHSLESSIVDPGAVLTENAAAQHSMGLLTKVKISRLAD